MGLDEWLANDPKDRDKLCDNCQEQIGTTLYERWSWVCDNCEELLTEEQEREDK